MERSYQIAVKSSGMIRTRLVRMEALVPFEKTIKSRDALDTEPFKECLARLEYIKRRGGILLLTGDPRVGKTLALRRCVDGLNDNLFKTYYTPLSTLSRADLLYNVLDFDDTHLPSLMHPSASLAPALMAYGEWHGCSGEDFITAFLTGFEVEAREKGLGAILSADLDLQHGKEGLGRNYTVISDN
jgi:hypothetical protein